MTSASLQNKIFRMRAAAPLELPKARVCTKVVLLAVGQHEQELQAAVAELKATIGNNWAMTHAFQFMSGRQASFCIDAAEESERKKMYLAHLIAKLACSGPAAHSTLDAQDFAQIVAKVRERYG